MSTKRKRNPLNSSDEKRKQNPPVTPLVAGLAIVGAAVGGKLIYDEVKKREAKKKAKKSSKVSPLSGTFANGATLGNNEMVIEDILPPIEFMESPNFRNPATGDIGPLSGGQDKIASTPAVLRSLVTNMTADANLLVYEYLLNRVGNENDDLSDPGMLQKAARMALGKTAPDVDWSKIYPKGTAQAKLIEGARVIGQIAYQSFWNKQSQNDGTMPPAPSGVDDWGLPLAGMSAVPGTGGVSSRNLVWRIYSLLNQGGELYQGVVQISPANLADAQAMEALSELGVPNVEAAQALLNDNNGLLPSLNTFDSLVLAQDWAANL